MNPRRAIKYPARLGWLAALVFLLALAGCKTERSSNDVTDAVVVGNSMAPSLLGKHRRIVCGECRFEVVSELAGSERSFAVCPNCGSRVGLEVTNVVEAADRVFLNVGQLPERWQVIGFQRDEDQQASIKRVLGLPGEAVSFEHGNVFLQTQNGARSLLRKNWAEQKITRVLVHDNRFQDQTARWLPVHSTDPMMAVVPKRFQTEQQCWLRFHPKRCYEHLPDQSWTPHIEDVYGFNQSISRQLNSVNEVCLEFEFDPASQTAQQDKAELLVAIVVGRQMHLARFVFASDAVDVQLFGPDGKLTDVTRCGFERDLLTCGISNIDQQIIVAVGDQQIHLVQLEPEENDASVEVLLSLQPATSADFKRLRLWRDAYYFAPVSSQELLQRQAGAGAAGTEGYFVVGDNLPVSRDSRYWQRPRVMADEILGVVDVGQ